MNCSGTFSARRCQTNMKTFVLLIIFTLSLCGIIFGQNEKTVKAGIVNAAASYLPKPDYPQEAKDFCANGKVEVEVLISEKGNVIEAKAISGDDLLREVSVDAAKKATFKQMVDAVPVKKKGIVIYNFDSFAKCIDLGIVNKKATYLAKPYYSPNLNATGIVKIQVVIDLVSGKVISARAVYGHPLLQPGATYAARQATFLPVRDLKQTRAKGILVYKYETRNVITDIEDYEKNVIGKPINLVKPPSASCNCKFAKIDSVIVEVEIDEQGNVIKAVAISGHPFLKAASEQAARSSKFSPTKVLGIPVKAKAVIGYEFVSSGKWTAKLTNITLKNIEAVEK